MLYLTCTTISSVDLAQYGVSFAKDWVSVECSTTHDKTHFYYAPNMYTKFKAFPSKTANVHVIAAI